MISMDSLLKLAIIPVLLICIFVYKKDPHPEPGKQVFKIFILGFVSAIPVLFTELFFNNMFGDDETLGPLGLLASVFVGVALVEEFYKWLAVRLFIYKSKHLEESYDAVVYSVFSSLGFACIENLLYVVVSASFSTGILRMLTAVPGHACYGVIMGIFFAKAKKKELYGQSGAGMRFMGLLVPTLLHGVYDYILMFMRLQEDAVAILGLFALWGLFVLTIIIVCFILILYASKRNERVAPYSQEELATMQSIASVQPMAPAVPVQQAPAVSPVAPAAPVQPVAPVQQPTVEPVQQAVSPTNTNMPPLQ